MNNMFGLEIHTAEPGIRYRETICQKAEGHHRHKKQSGGSGQFGEVFLCIESLERGAGFEFASEVVDGAIPGYPMQGIRVVVYDGKHHSVDSKEIASLRQGKRPFRGCKSCKASDS